MEKEIKSSKATKKELSAKDRKKVVGGKWNDKNTCNNWGPLRHRTPSMLRCCKNCVHKKYLAPKEYYCEMEMV